MSRTTEIVSDLHAVAARRVALDRAELSLIATARSQRVSWATIADALALRSRQAAQQRYQRVAKRVASEPDQQITESAASDDSARRIEQLRAVKVPEKLHPTRIRLIKAAAIVLSERGYASTRLSDIAVHAGIQPGSFYYHYRSKDDLTADVLKIGVARANQAVISTVMDLPADTSGIERLKTAIEAHLRAMLRLDSIAKAHVFAYSQVPGLVKDRVHPVRRANAELWSALIQDALDEGALRTDIDPFLIQLFIVNTIDAALNWSWRVTSAQDLASPLSRLVLEGVGV